MTDDDEIYTAYEAQEEARMAYRKAEEHPARIAHRRLARDRWYVEYEKMRALGGTADAIRRILRDRMSTRKVKR